MVRVEQFERLGEPERQPIVTNPRCSLGNNCGGIVHDTESGHPKDFQQAVTNCPHCNHSSRGKSELHCRRRDFSRVEEIPYPTESTPNEIFNRLLQIAT